MKSIILKHLYLFYMEILLILFKIIIIWKNIVYIRNVRNYCIKFFIIKKVYGITHCFFSPQDSLYDSRKHRRDGDLSRERSRPNIAIVILVNRVWFPKSCDFHGQADLSQSPQILTRGDINLTIYRERQNTERDEIHDVSHPLLPRHTSPNKVSSHFIARLLNMSSIPHRDLYFLPLPDAAYRD